MVFQEPMTALNPLMRIGKQLAEPLLLHRGLARGAARVRAIELADKVGLPDPDRIVRAFPHQLSGGQRQRVGIAIALACEPAVLIADEPTTALDVTVQAEILALLRDLVDEQGASLLFITHDLAVLSSVVSSAGRAGGRETRRTDRHRRARARRSTNRTPPKLLRAARAAAFPTPGDLRLLVAERLNRSLPLPRRTSRRRAPGRAGRELQLAEGGRLGIVGESGSGKSTLLRLLLGLDRPDSGTVRFRDREVRAGKASSAALVPARGAGGVPGPARLARSAHARAARSSPNRWNALTCAEDHAARIAEVLAEVELEPDAATRYPHQFSGGQRQRIAIARALAPRPRRAGRRRAVLGVGRVRPRADHRAGR